ncbi:ABC transporter ATP-binding protein [Caproiciproducens sp. R1]|uniref:ABC transporter ATP-binding protein n=1 Tax=Acutalibacteraceae TaxID=3082771 RepID=UPI002E0FBBDC
MNAIEIHDLTKVLKQQKVLIDINLILEQGGVYGLYGQNGSGKSMLLRSIAGLIYPTKGTVTVLGKQLGKDISFPQKMGLVIENVGFWPYYTGFENLKTLASIQNKITDDDIRENIKRVGLNPNDKRTYHKYSLGMKRRLGIAQAVMEKPDLILLDEPTNALDDDGIDLVRQIVREENERGATIILASHNKEDLTLLCSRFYKMSDGRLKEGEAPK